MSEERITVKVTPKSRENRVVGWEEGILKVKVTAPPDKGEANRAVIALLSEYFHIPQRDIILVQGATCRLKQFIIQRD